MSKKLVLVIGFPGSGKTAYAKELENKGYSRINRDMFDTPGNVCSSKDFHEKHLDHVMSLGTPKIVVDNTYPTIAARKLAVDLAVKHGYDIECWVMGTSIEDTQYNVATRMIQRYGQLVAKDHNEQVKNDSNMFPPAVLFAHKKKYEAPTKEEGFSAIRNIKFERAYNPKYNNKAVIVDYDGTLRTTKSGAIYPTKSDDIEILPKRLETLKRYKDQGYVILGVSNQSGIATGKLTKSAADACFTKTNEMLGMNIDVLYCPHGPVPVTCYCRKPGPGNGVVLIEKYKLDPRQCIMVGDMTSDKTFAKRCGFKYVDQAVFFK